MRITVLAVPDCPNAPVAIERITAALAGRPASVELVEVAGETEAARLGMTGISPPPDRPRSRVRLRWPPPGMGALPGRCWPSWTARTS